MSDGEPDDTGSPDERLIARAKDFFKRSADAESENRTNALQWQRFRDGDQWLAADRLKRKDERRACITINKTDAYCTKVENEQLKQRPRLKVDPADGKASRQAGDLIQGMFRHIENAKGGGDLAYATGFSSAVTGGRGFWRIRGDYESEDSFDQELFLEPIDNPLSCYGDPNSVLPDGSDQMEFGIADLISKEQFKREYPHVEMANFTEMGSGDGGLDWITEHQVRIAEYFWIEHTRGILHELTDGSTVWQIKGKKDDPDVLSDTKVAKLSARGIFPTGKSRPSYRRAVKWAKLTAMAVLEKADIPGRFIPTVSIYGKITVIDGKRKWSGIVKNAMDPATMFNLYRSATAEIVSGAPKAKWLIAEGQDEGHESEWATANLSATAALRYKPTDVDGKPAPPPQRIQPEGVPQGAMELAQSMSDDLTAVLGIVDPAMRIGGNVSGKALQSERIQADDSNYHLFVQMTRSIAQTGRILLSMFPAYYSGPRMVRIVGEDGQPDLAAINGYTEGGKKPIDITVGQYAIDMDTGPGYSTRRQEALEGFGQLLDSPLGEEVAKVGGDLVVRMYDAPGMDVLADRLAAANPLSEIDEQSEIPPAVQMKLKGQAQQMQQMGQAIQQLQQVIKSRSDLKQMEENAETQREHMRVTASVHDTQSRDSAKLLANRDDNETWTGEVAATNATKRYDTDVKAHAALSVAEINAIRELLKTRVNNEHDMKTLEKAAEHEDAQQATETA